MSRVVGSGADARLERAVAEDVLHVERHEEERREHRERHGERDERRAEERGRAEEREVDHRRADPALDDREADEAEDGEHEQHDDPRRAPAPGVALDEREHERREADGQRRDAREVDGARHRLVARGRRREQRGRRAQTIATGTLTKKIDCHDTCSTRKPPRQRPDRQRERRDAGPGPDRLAALLRRERVEMIDRVPGIIRAAPLPCSRRPTTSQVCVCAKPMNALLQREHDDPDEEHASGGRRCLRGARRSRAGRRRRACTR